MLLGSFAWRLRSYLKRMDPRHDIAQSGIHELMSLDQIQAFKLVRANVQIKVRFSVHVVSCMACMLMRIVNQFEFGRLEFLGEDSNHGAVFGSIIILQITRRVGRTVTLTRSTLLQRLGLLLHDAQHVEKAIVATGCETGANSSQFNKLGVHRLNIVGGISRQAPDQQGHKSLGKKTIAVALKGNRLVVGIERGKDMDRTQTARHHVLGCFEAFVHGSELIGHVQELLIAKLVVANALKGGGQFCEFRGEAEGCNVVGGGGGAKAGG